MPNDKDTKNQSQEVIDVEVIEEDTNTSKTEVETDIDTNSIDEELLKLNETKDTNNTKKSREQSRIAEILEIIRKYEIVKEGFTPQKLRLILEDLGPTFIKLGQIMSMRTDFLPKEYCKELEKLRTDVKPLTITEVKHAIEEEYHRSVEDIFDDFETEPLGSASIAQVHRAKIKDTNRRVVVKVQRPNIKDIMTQDMYLLRKVSKTLKLVPISNTIDFNSLLDEMWSISQEELDFRVEAGHIKEFYSNNKDYKGVSCPTVEDELLTSKVLVMEYVEGYSIGDIDSIIKDGIDRNAIGKMLTDNYMKQVLDDGFFHADPHPGNIKVRNGEIVWIDMGMMGRLSKKDRKLFKKAIQSVIKRDVNDLISVIMSFGTCKGTINYSRLYEDVDSMLEKYCSADMGDVDLAVFLEELINLAITYNISMPKGLSMLARGIMTLEGVIATVSPEVNVVDVASDRLELEILQNFDVKKEFKNYITTVMNSGAKSLNLPALLADLLEATIKGRTKVNLDVTGSDDIVKQLSGMVNKFIACVISSALLISSSTICTTGMKPTILGIPALGFLGYVIAIILSSWILFSEKFKKKK